METKEIGRYKMTFQSNVCSDNFDYNELNITIDDGLKDLLKTAVVPGEVDYQIDLGNYHEAGKRGLVKGYILNSFTSSRAKCLFDSRILSTGRLNLKFSSISSRDYFRSEFKELVKQFIKIIQTAEVNETVTYTLTQ